MGPVNRLTERRSIEQFLISGAGSTRRRDPIVEPAELVSNRRSLMLCERIAGRRRKPARARLGAAFLDG